MIKNLKTAHSLIAFLSKRALFIALLSFLFSFFAFEQTSYASINESFTYQGKIVNTDGTNVTNTEASCIVGGVDTCDFQINIYDAVTGGTLVWQETKSDVEIGDNDGIFNLVLDCSGTFSSCNQNGGPDFTSGELFIEVDFDPDGDGDFAEGETFTPRRELTAVPYAFNARSADQLGGQADTSYLRSDVNDQFDGGNTLTIAGTIDVTGALQIDGTAVDATAVELDYVDGATVVNGGIILANGTNFAQDAAGFYFDVGSDYLGIGNSIPSSALDVTGNAEISGTATIGDGSAISADTGLIIDYDATFTGVGEQLAVLGATTAAANTNAYGARIDPESITIASGTTNLVASLYIDEPNVTETGTLTNSATLYIAGAADEADNNYSVWVDAGAVQIDETVSIDGVLTASEDFTIDATTPTITINSAETFTITDGADSFVVNTNASSFEFTDGTNSFVFDVDSGPLYAGTARPTRQVTLSPEFNGASLTGDGSSNAGTMTSDFCENGASADIPDTNTAVCNTSGDIHNYYSWTTSQGSAQDYDIWIRWRVPDNFSDWTGDPIEVWGKRTDATNNAVQVYVYDTAGTLENAGGTQVAGTNWTETSVESSFAGTYTAGSYMTIRIAMTADTGGDSVQVGEISLDYLTTN